MKILIAVLSTCAIIEIALGTLEIPNPIYYNITPNQGAIYESSDSTNNNYLNYYLYHVNINELKYSSGSKDPLNMQIYNPETSQWLDANINTSTNGSRDRTPEGTISFKVNIYIISTPFVGLSKFRFVDSKGNPLKDAINGNALEFSGPKILSNFKDESYVKEDDGTYTYSVWIRSDDSITVGLHGLRPEIDIWEWCRPNLTSNSWGWTKLEWRKAPFYKIIKFEILI